VDLSRREALRKLALGALAAATTRVWAGEESPAEGKQPRSGEGTLPPLPRRGIHVEGGGQGAVPALERLIAEIAPALGLNWVIVEVGGGFQYESHPECADENPMTKASAQKLAALARAAKIELVPMYNCLGHQSWHEKTGALLRAHPEFNEAPELDATAEDFYCMSWCPSNPDVNAVVFDLMDELIDAFGAKAFHVGMDEVFVLGQCPRCQGAPNAELFAKAVNDLHGHLVGRRKVEMQMWGDRLLDGKATGYGAWEASENDTWQAIDKVPKDIVMCDWHYGLDNPEFPSVRIFQEAGFQVWPAGWNGEAAVRRFIEVARNESGPRMLGYLCTTWMDVTPLVEGLAAEPEPQPEEAPQPTESPEARGSMTREERQQRRLRRMVTGVRLGAELSRGTI
jgi:hypothetical protein